MRVVVAERSDWTVCRPSLCRLGHRCPVSSGADTRTVAVGAFAVLLAAGLGALAASTAGLAAGLTAALAGMVPAAVLAVVLEFRSRSAAAEREQSSVAQVTLEQRLQSLSVSMQESARLVEQVSAELDARAIAARRLQEEADYAQALVTMHKEQTEAIERLVRSGMESELAATRRDIFRDSLRLAIPSFVLGGLVTLLITLLVHPLH
jgi:hypothetical protein